MWMSAWTTPTLATPMLCAITPKAVTLALVKTATEAMGIPARISTNARRAVTIATPMLRARTPQAVTLALVTPASRAMVSPVPTLTNAAPATTVDVIHLRRA